MSSLSALEVDVHADTTELRDAIADARQAIDDLEDAFDRIENASVTISTEIESTDDRPTETDD